MLDGRADKSQRLSVLLSHSAPVCAPQVPQPPQYIVLALTFAAIDGLVMLVYASSGARAVQLFRTPMVVCWINRLSGGALVTLAGALALYRRAHN